MKRGGTLKRTELKRGSSSNLQRSGSKRTPGQDEFWAAVTENGTKECFYASLGGCDNWPTGKPDAHHLIEKQAIKSEYATEIHRVIVLKGGDKAMQWLAKRRTEALKDERNGISCCRLHHAALTAHVLTLTREQLPESVFAFAADYGLTAQLEKLYPGSPPTKEIDER